VWGGETLEIVKPRGSPRQKCWGGGGWPAEAAKEACTASWQPSPHSLDNRRPGTLLECLVSGGVAVHRCHDAGRSQWSVALGGLHTTGFLVRPKAFDQGIDPAMIFNGRKTLPVDTYINHDVDEDDIRRSAHDVGTHEKMDFDRRNRSPRRSTRERVRDFPPSLQFAQSEPGTIPFAILCGESQWITKGVPELRGELLGEVDGEASRCWNPHDARFSTNKVMTRQADGPISRSASNDGITD